MNNQSSHVDVVVVGAGFAGLTAARDLGKAEVSVGVLEAEDRTVTGLWMDHSIPGAETGGMAGFFAGGHAQAWAARSPEERRTRVLEDLATYLGAAANNPIEYVERSWPAAPWQRGTFWAMPSTGAQTAFGTALREPVGRIHWAGTETADANIGYYDGAIQSGERVAGDILKLLRPSQSSSCPSRADPAPERERVEKISRYRRANSALLCAPGTQPCDQLRGSPTADGHSSGILLGTSTLFQWSRRRALDNTGSSQSMRIHAQPVSG